MPFEWPDLLVYFQGHTGSVETKDCFEFIFEHTHQEEKGGGGFLNTVVLQNKRVGSFKLQQKTQQETTVTRRLTTSSQLH